MHTSPITVLFGALIAALACPLDAAELPERAAGLWQLTKQTDDSPRPLPTVLQCTDPATDRALGGNAFLVHTGGCARLEVSRQDDGWRIDSLCASEAGEVHELTELSGDFKTGYTMTQVATFAEYGMEVRQTVTATRIGECTGEQRPGYIYIGGQGFALTAH